MTLFLRLRADLLAPHRPALDLYIGTLERIMRGGVDWALASDRYTTTGETKEPGSPLVAVRPDGWSDTPIDTGTFPPDIPSIAWWWHHDPASR